MNDSLGDRMKLNYENRTRFSLPLRANTIIRVDGKAFHTYTRGLTRPFDIGLINDMDGTAIYLCKNIMGCKFAYVQSDEISLFITDYDQLNTQAWFDNNLQKMTSVSASMATRAFNELRLQRLGIDRMKWAEFDSRVFQIPMSQEVINYFIWRQQDATRNSISAVAQSLYSHKELNGKNSNQLQEMIFQKGINWNDYPIKYKRGRIILKETYTKEIDPIVEKSTTSTRTRWVSVEPPIFTHEPDFLLNLFPT